MVEAIRRYVAFAAVVVTGCITAHKVDNTPVAALDLSRYLGEWYEIARFDHSFERGVEKCKANYVLRKDGGIDVVNTGVKDGKPKEARGKAKKTDMPGLLRVSFFGPFVTFLATIPSCVMGGVCITLYGFIAVSGLKMLQKVDLGQNKNLFVVSVILIAGIGGMTLKIGQVTITEIAAALILGIITNLILSRKKDEGEEVAAA